jgi:predicted transcriptional regulator
LEVKIGKDTIRDSQLKRKREIENDGGIYYLCKWTDFETFQTEIQNLIPIE